MTKRFLILANPIAGGGRSKRVAPHLAQELEKRGGSAEVCFSQAAGDLRQRAAKVEPGEFDAVVSVGGDGTLNEVLNGLPDPTVPLCPMALGTANVLALELGLPKRPEPLAEILMAGRTLQAAIGLCEGRRFLLFVGAGMDGSIVERLEQVRTGTLGKIGWVRPILQTVWSWPLRDFVVRAAGQEFTGVTSALVTRVRNYGGMLKLPEVDVRDGHLHLLLFRQRSRWSYLCAVVRGMAGRLRSGRDLEMLVVDELEIGVDGTPPSAADGTPPSAAAAEPSPYQIDGDLGGSVAPGQPLRVSLFPEAARLFAGPAMIRS